MQRKFKVMLLQQCNIHRDTIVNYIGFCCPLCGLVKAVKELHTLSVDNKGKDPIHLQPEEVREQIFDASTDASGIELK